MKPFATLSACALVIGASLAVARDHDGSSPNDFAYRMQVLGNADSAAYRVALPLALYRKIVHANLSDLRVFNAAGEQVPFAIERPASGTVSNAATALSLFPLQDDSSATLDAVRVTIESGRGAINVQTGAQTPPTGRINTYLVDGRSLDTAVAALRMEWPEDAADFAGRVRVEVSDSLGDWRFVAGAAPVANLHSGAGRLVEQRVEFSPTKAKYWRLSWVGPPAPFVLTSVLAEPARQNVEARHSSRNFSAAPSKKVPGEFEYDLGARLPVDRVNLELPDTNTVVEVELLSRTYTTDTWHTVRRCGFYRLKSDGEELRNGPVSVALNTDPHWLLRTNPKSGGLGSVAPHLVVEWVPHEVVFVARGAGPFYVAYGSATADSAAVSLAVLPKNVSIAPASLSEPETLGGDVRLSPPPAPYAWKAALLWAVLLAGAGLLAWMAFRLSRDFSRT
ncbi:MAG TPA: DUF3999 domain-containing protein [Steroidobacteraceae bacterium]|nr:DUF3999 domain-containing protein [Steroidobacteraceae bacterium]